MPRILIEDALKKYKAILLEYKQLAKDIAGDKWSLNNLKGYLQTTSILGIRVTNLPRKWMPAWDWTSASTSRRRFGLSW